MVERYAHTARPEAGAEPPRRSTTSTVAIVVLKDGHYYQVRITPRPLVRCWELEAVYPMLPGNMPLPDGPTRLSPDQPPDTLTTIMSGRDASWHPGNGLYCLWLWAQQRWQHTREWSATWTFHLDGQQQAEVIPPNDRANPPTTRNLCPVFAIHQIQALAAGQVSPAISTEEEVRAVHAALLREIFNALRTALIRHPGNPAMP